MNIQEFIKAKEEEFDEKFPPARDGDYTKHPLPHIKHFLSQSLLEYNEKIKEMCKDKKKRKNSIKFFGGNGYYNQQGYNQALDDIITNLNIK